MNSHVSKSKLSTSLLLSVSSSCTSSETEETSPFSLQHTKLQLPFTPISKSFSYRPLAILSGHIASVSCLSLCGDYILSASQSKDIIVWQNPDFKFLNKFGHGDGSVKSLVTAGNKIFSAHQDGKIRVWKVSKSSENVFKLVETLPTTKDYLGKFMKQSNYVQTRRHHKRLWIEHSDSISCLTVCNGLIYSGSWDKTLKVWKLSSFKCLESIKAHDDAINGLGACKGVVYSASADGKIKAWGRKEGNKMKNKKKKISHCLKGVLKGRQDSTFNCVVVSPDGKCIYGGDSNGFIIEWEKIEDFITQTNFDPRNHCLNQFNESWKLVSTTRAHEMAVLCMCLRGKIMLSGSSDKNIRIWKREGSNGGLCKIGVISGHKGPVKCLEASSRNTSDGGFFLYSGSMDKSLRVWWVPMNINEEDTEENSSAIASRPVNQSIISCS
ncbi:protein JINGUBANG-like [Neltuma alba]|uniref:protein JINGUBANG-like n=1 Tax=Neltuma alba TaxID=207710 RepID=UPI0010A3DE94|nr:protein JINGUBANG-like [Prosopis alba]